MRVFFFTYSPGVLACAFLLCSLGCGSSGLVPVSGQVLTGIAPLKTGTVTFYPDQTKGNTANVAVGEIDENGTYTLYTNRRAGVAPGWYRVTVVAEKPRSEDTEGEGTEGADAYAPPVYLVAEEYMDADLTPLSVEVKANAPENAYRLELAPAPR